MTDDLETKIAAYEKHKENMKEASRKYYAKINRRDFTDKNGKLWEFSKLEVTEEEKQKNEKRAIHKKEYHKNRYQKNSEKFIQQAREYRKKNKAEKKTKSPKSPSLVDVEIPVKVSLLVSDPIPV